MTENKTLKPETKNNEIMLEVVNLKKHFNVSNSILKKNKKILTAVDGLDFFIRKGETFGLVGESGCGKSTAGRSILRLVEPAEIVGGRLLFEGKELLSLSEREMRALRWSNWPRSSTW